MPTGKQPARTMLNELDGRTWERYSISVWDITKTRAEAQMRHPAVFPLELCDRLLRVYTRKGDVVLDPFAGSGSVIAAAVRLGRKAIAFEISPDYVRLIKSRVCLGDEAEPIDGWPRIMQEDAANLLMHVPEESLDFALTSPPYWDVHRRRRTADRGAARPYSTLPQDLGNAETYEEFLSRLAAVFEAVRRALKPRRRCVVVVMDIRRGSSFIPFHMDLCHLMADHGFVLEDIIIWDRRREYNNLRPLGYPSVFIVNKVHEYILIFRRE